jgi:Protein of unknown function (DUF3306)
VSEERSTLSRWSERKAAARRGDAPPEPADEARAVADIPPAPQEASGNAAAPEPALPADAAPAADDDMPALPSIDELNAESDYTVFLGEKVPEQLRRAALRKLWTSDPVLANLDGLNDYNEDYNLTTTVIGAVQSAWQAGRGYAEEVEEKLDRVDEALGTSSDSNEEPQQAELQQDESQAASETARVSQDSDALDESETAGDNSADALRQVTAAATDAKLAHRREDSGE